MKNKIKVSFCSKLSLSLLLVPPLPLVLPLSLLLPPGQRVRAFRGSGAAPPSSKETTAFSLTPWFSKVPQPLHDPVNCRVSEVPSSPNAERSRARRTQRG